MTAKEYLKQLDKLDMLIKNKLIERQQLRDMAYSVTAQMGGERVQSSGNQQKMAGAIEKYIDIEKEIDVLIDRFVDTKREICTTIEQLDAVEYDVLHMRYIQKKSYYEIAEAKERDYGWCTTIHGRALAHVQKILDGHDSVRKSYDL